MPTVKEIVSEAIKQKAVSVRQVTQHAKRVYPEMKITDKDVNDYLYCEAYGDDFERCQRINNIYG